VLLSATGLLARADSDGSPVTRAGRRQGHDALRGWCATTTRSDIGLVTSLGRVLRLSTLDLPALPATDGAPSLTGGIPVADLVELGRDEEVLTVISLIGAAPTLALGTASGVVKRVAPGEVPNNKDQWEAISLRDGDVVIGAAAVLDEDEVVFVSSDASLLHFPAAAVRPQGRAAGGMAGINLARDQSVVFFGAAPAAIRPELAVVTIAGSSRQLPGMGGGSVKVTPYELFPAKGRATGGVRSHRFLKGEDRLVLAWVGEGPPRAVGAGGQPIDLPALDMRRDGSGAPLRAPVAAIG
jgi:DNA gyrase subunit A